MSGSATALVEQELAQTRSDSFYRPGLDILRVLAFLLVFVAHGLAWHVDKPTQTGAIARAGEFGVCIFFFLSSYLITELLLREKRDTHTIVIRSFYVRRILRIWPLYFAMITVGWFCGLFLPSHTVSLAWGLATAAVHELVHGRSWLSTRIHLSAVEHIPGRTVLPGVAVDREVSKP